jgi:hypothetical protein
MEAKYHEERRRLDASTGYLFDLVDGSLWLGRFWLRLPENA